MSAARRRHGSAAASPWISSTSGYAAATCRASASVVRSRSTTTTRTARPVRRPHRTRRTANAAAPSSTSSTPSRRFIVASAARSALTEGGLRKALVAPTGALWSVAPEALVAPTRRSPPEESAFGGEAGTEGDHQRPVAGDGRFGAQRLVQHEEDRRRRHVAVAAQHRARVADLLLAQVQQRSGAVDHPPSRGVQDPVADVLALEPLRRHQDLGHLAHHGGADTTDVLREDHARPPARILESHRA